MAEKSEFDKMVDGVEDVDPSEDEAQTGIQLANFQASLDLGSEDLMIPRLRLMQGLSTEVQDGSASPGQWVLSGYDPQDNVTYVPLLFARNRTLRDEEGSILCKSRDAKTGEGEPGGNCDECIMNKWIENEKGPNTPPKCAFSYVYIGYVPEFESIALVEFRRTSINAGKMLNTVSAQRGLGNFAVKLKTSKQTGKRGTFYQAVVQPTQIEEEVLMRARTALG